MPSSAAHANASIAHSSGAKVPDQRERERRVDHLPVARDQRDEQQRERDHHDPVRDLDHRPVLEPPVPEDLREQRPRPRPDRRPPPRQRPPDPHGPHDRARRRARTAPTPTTVATTTTDETDHLQRIHAATLPARRGPRADAGSPTRRPRPESRVSTEVVRLRRTIVGSDRRPRRPSDAGGGRARQARRRLGQGSTGGRVDRVRTNPQCITGASLDVRRACSYLPTDRRPTRPRPRPHRTEPDVAAAPHRPGDRSPRRARCSSG